MINDNVELFSRSKMNNFIHSNQNFWWGLDIDGKSHNYKSEVILYQLHMYLNEAKKIIIVTGLGTEILIWEIII